MSKDFRGGPCDDGGGRCVDGGVVFVEEECVRCVVFGVVLVRCRRSLFVRQAWFLPLSRICLFGWASTFVAVARSKERFMRVPCNVFFRFRQATDGSFDYRDVVVVFWLCSRGLGGVLTSCSV